MQLDGIHHITCVTADALRNLDFYTRVLGLRLVKKTVNQDDPNVYHLFYADEAGTPGADITFFELPDAPAGLAGDGMVHTIVWRLAGPKAFDFWESRLAAEGVAVVRDEGSLRFADPDGLQHELAVASATDAPLVAQHPEIGPAYALQGFDGLRAYASAPTASAVTLEETLGLARLGDAAWQLRGPSRQGFYTYDEPPRSGGRRGAGTVHHVAFSTALADQEAWHARVEDAGLNPSPVIDRFWFRSIYFREPSGVLFELATVGPGFTADEPLERLGETLTLPPAFEPMRSQIEASLTPLPNPRAASS